MGHVDHRHSRWLRLLGRNLLLVHQVQVTSVLALLRQLVKLLLNLLLTLVLRGFKVTLALLADLQLLQLVSHLRIERSLTFTGQRRAELQRTLTRVYERRLYRLLWCDCRLLPYLLKPSL